MAQLYRYVPGDGNVSWYVLPFPVSTAPLGKVGVLTDCTVCGTPPVLTHVHVTVPPATTVSTAGFDEPFRSLRNTLFPRVTVMALPTGPPPPPPPPAIPMLCAAPPHPARTAVTSIRSISRFVRHILKLLE